MIDNLAPILIGVAAIVMTVIIWAIARRIFLGELVPVEVQKLLNAKEDEVKLLRDQNAVLKEERNNEKAQLRQMIKDSTEAIFSVKTFLDRYELTGGFATGPQVRRKGEDKKLDE